MLRPGAIVTITDDQLGKLKELVVAKLGDPLALVAPNGYKDSLALCIIDSVQSTGIKYVNVENVVRKYRGHRRAQEDDPNTDGATQLLRTFDELRGPDGWARDIGTRHRTSSRADAPLKAVAIQSAARALLDRQIETAADLRTLDPASSTFNQVESAWLHVKAQSSGITWRYLLMLAGVPGVKPDRMIKRFVATALGLPESMTTGFAADAVAGTADSMGISASALDHAIWRWQRQPKRLRS